MYGSPVLQAMLGLAGTTEPPRKSPGIEPARAALIQQRIGELKARVAEGGPREAAIRALVYVGMGGAGVDERAFNELREIRSENQGLTLQAFKQVLREQYFSLMLDRDAALAALPKMLPADAATRTRILDAVRRTVEAAGRVSGEKAQRLEQIEKLFAAAAATRQLKPAPRKAARAMPAQRKK